MRVRRSEGLLIAVAALTAGCSTDAPAPRALAEPSQVALWVTVQAIVPSVGSTLNAGDAVTFAAKVRYLLADQAATRLEMDIRDDRGNPLAVPRPTAELPMSQRSATVSSRVILPANARGVRVSVDIVRPGERPTRLAEATYTVR